MTGVAYGFRDDLTDDEIDLLEREGVLFWCSEHEVYEAFEPETFDEDVNRIRHGGRNN